MCRLITLRQGAFAIFRVFSTPPRPAASGGLRSRATADRPPPIGSRFPIRLRRSATLHVSLDHASPRSVCDFRVFSTPPRPAASGGLRSRATADRLPPIGSRFPTRLRRSATLHVLLDHASPRSVRDFSGFLYPATPRGIWRVTLPRNR